MKLKLLGFLILFVFYSCGYYGHKEQAKQIENVGFISFKGDLQNVSIVFDGTNRFLPKKNPDSNSQDFLYQTSSGMHRIHIYKNDKLIIDEKFYIGNQETKEFTIRWNYS